MQLKLALNWQFCLSLLSIGIVDVYHHSQLTSFMQQLSIHCLWKTLCRANSLALKIDVSSFEETCHIRDTEPWTTSTQVTASLAEHASVPHRYWSQGWPANMALPSFILQLCCYPGKPFKVSLGGLEGFRCVPMYLELEFLLPRLTVGTIPHAGWSLLLSLLPHTRLSQSLNTHTYKWAFFFESLPHVSQASLKLTV